MDRYYRWRNVYRGLRDGFDKANRGGTGMNNTLDRLDRHFGPMRREDRDGDDLDIERELPEEFDDREFGNPVGFNDPSWPYEVTP